MRSGTYRRCGEDVVESVVYVMSCLDGECMCSSLGLSDPLSVLCCRPLEPLQYCRWWWRARLR